MLHTYPSVVPTSLLIFPMQKITYYINSLFQSALNMVEWTREQKASGSASVKCLTDKLGGWKSDQFLK